MPRRSIVYALFPFGACIQAVSGFTWSTAKNMTYGNLGMLQKTEVVVP